MVEIVSPGDESWDKLPYYAAHHVDEILIADPHQQTINWLALEHGEYRPIEHSGLIDFGPRELAQRLDWPAVLAPRASSSHPLGCLALPPCQDRARCYRR